MLVLAISGLQVILPYSLILKDVREIKILVGINVDQMFAEAQRKGFLFCIVLSETFIE